MFDCLTGRLIFSNTLKEAGSQMASLHHVHVLLQSAAPPARPVREWYTSLNFYAVLHEEGLWFN